MDEEKRLEILGKLANAFGVPGYESEVRKVLSTYVYQEDVAIDYDDLGSLILTKKGKAESPRVMLAAHMDEIGFVVTYITDDGFIRFEPLGRWREQTLLSQQVVLRGGNGPIWGVVGSRPPHILNEEERDKLTKIDDMFIDIGAQSRKQVVKDFGLREGDPIAPYAPFRVLRDRNLVAGKAWDNRAGCALLIEALTGLGDHDNTVVAVGTAQEEIGRRGAHTSVHKVKPDIALIFEGILAGDYPGVDREKIPTALGKGCAIVFYDESMYPNRRLLDLAIDVAKENGLLYQLVAARGGNDAGIIQLSRTGVPSLVLGVPTRYIHTHIGIMDVRDLAVAGELVRQIITRLDQSTVNWIKDWSRE